MRVDDNAARGRPQNASKGPQSGGLTCAVGADETHDFAASHLEREVVDRGKGPVGAPEVLNGNRHERGVLDLGVSEVLDHVAQHASALKAHRQSIKNREHNRQFRSRFRGALRSIRTAIDNNDLAGAKSALKQTISLIDKMASKGIIHRNAAGRYKSRLQTRLAAKSKAA